MMQNQFSILFYLLFFSTILAQKGLVTSHAMVVSARVEASNIGSEIMKKGGNAFDAMAATELALAVAYPYAGNIGGGGFMVFRLKDGTTGSLDYREKAPLKANEKMYWDKDGNVIPKKSTDGALAVGVPGTIAGIWAAHQKYGKLPWKEVIQPAIDLTQYGIILTQHDVERFKKYRADFQRINPEKVVFDNDWNVGDTIKYPALAQTLSTIRDKGYKAFYKGKNAKIMVDFIQKNGGILSLKDLKKYQPVWRKPIEFTYKDLKITSMAPPSSGGVTLSQIMKTIEPYDIQSLGHNSGKYIQLLTEAERRAYADRNYFLGDPDFVKIPLDTLLSKKYLTQRMQNFSWEKATPSAEISHGKISSFYESNETTHYSIVDAEGNAVSVTTTLNGAFGSKLYNNTLGFFFNNEMDDFSTKAGVPNSYGLIGAEANKIEPEKRMLSSMTPSLVEKNGKLWMVLGSPGGSTIITSVLQNILNVYEFKMGMQESVSQPRFHHQWLPDEVLLENKGFDDTIMQELQQKGYLLKKGESVVVGKVNAILIPEQGTLEAGADPRGDETAAGF